MRPVSMCRRALAGLLTLALTTSTRQSRSKLCFETRVQHYFSALPRRKAPACTSVVRTPANAVGARCQRLYGSYLMWRAALPHARSANAARNTLSQRYISTHATEASSGDVRPGDRCISMQLECDTCFEWRHAAVRNVKCWLCSRCRADEALIRARPGSGSDQWSTVETSHVIVRHMPAISCNMCRAPLQLVGSSWPWPPFRNWSCAAAACHDMSSPL